MIMALLATGCSAEAFPAEESEPSVEVAPAQEYVSEDSNSTVEDSADFANGETAPKEEADSESNTATAGAGDYADAYTKVAKDEKDLLGDNVKYDLIDMDGDDTPELLVTCDSVISLYSYSNGQLECLMEHMGSGAGGNLGYSYAPGKGVIMNPFVPFYGAMEQIFYMSKREGGNVDADYSVTEYHFDDVDGDGFPSEEELAAVGDMKTYKTTYENYTSENLSEDQVKAKIDELSKYEYIDMVATMSYDDLVSKLTK